MHHGPAAPSWVMLAYLVAGVCFILALRGLSSPESSRRGNRFGMAGMAIAVVTTLIHYVPSVEIGRSLDVDAAFENLAWILGAIAIGAVIGLVTARRIAMTAMPQLVAACTSAETGFQLAKTSSGRGRLEACTKAFEMKVSGKSTMNAALLMTSGVRTRMPRKAMTQLKA